MEKSAEIIGKKEFDDVWMRVSGEETTAAATDMAAKTESAPVQTTSETASKALTALTKTSETLGGLVSSVLTKKNTLNTLGYINDTGTGSIRNMAAQSAATKCNTTESNAATARSAESEARTNASRAITQSEAERLIAIMEATSQTSRECSMLAMQCPGEIRRTSRSMAQACQATINELNTQYCMLTGLKCSPGSTILQATAGERLAAIIETECAVCEACAEAADETAIASLQTAYTHTAAIAERIARTAEQLLYKLNRT